MRRSPALPFIFIHRSHSPGAGLLLFLPISAASGARQRHSIPEAEASKIVGDNRLAEQPDSVAGFLKNYGFRDADAKKLLAWNPRWLLLDVEKTLLPRFRALEALGFDRSEVVSLVRSNPSAINLKIETVGSKIQVWQDLLGSKDVLMKTFKHDNWILGYSVSKRIRPNIETLQEWGIAGRKLTMILRWQPTLIALKADVLKALIGRVEELGVPRSSGMYPWALWVLSGVSVERFKAQMELLRGFGWSESDFLAAFRRSPTFLTCSSKTLRTKMEFLANEAGCAPSSIARHPVILTLSLEKRLTPRYQILAALRSRGCPTDKYRLTTYMVFSEKQFVERYLLRHKNKYPDLIESYNAKVIPTSVLSTGG